MVKVFAARAVAVRTERVIDTSLGLSEECGNQANEGLLQFRLKTISGISVTVPSFRTASRCLSGEFGWSSARPPTTSLHHHIAPQ